MNDFFTELDADLRTESRIPESTKKHIPKGNKHPFVAGNTCETSAPAHNKQEPKKRMTADRYPFAPAPGRIMVEVRSQMMQSWVVVVVFRADEKTKTLLGHLKLETRGFAHLDEVREVHKAVIKRARVSYEDTVRDIPDIEEKDLIKIIRHDLEIFLAQRFERNPVVIPIIVYV